jgi:hypothetical protein
MTCDDDAFIVIKELTIFTSEGGGEEEKQVSAGKLAR